MEGIIDDGLMLIVLVVAVVSGFASYKIAEAKGHNGAGYFLLGLLLPLVGILVAGFMPPAESGSGSSRGGANHALAALRDPNDPKLAKLLEFHQPKLTSAVERCTAGERVLALGTGAWSKRPSFFLLTDRQLVLVPLHGKRQPTVTNVEGVTLDESRGELKSVDGVLRPYPKSPFTADELDARIRRRNEFKPYVEVVAPGRLAPTPGPTGSEEAAPTPGQSKTTAAEELERLDALHRSGAIDDDEFAELKRQLVWGDGRSTESSG